MAESVMTTKEAAELLGVHPVTLRAWRSKSEHLTCTIMEDCQGLRWWLSTPRKVLYLSDSVVRLKELLDRRKEK